MSFTELLSEKKPAILKKWFDSILDTYPSETADFLKKQKDRFANPVGSTIYGGMDSLLNSLLSNDDADTISKYLDDIVRIRAVQDFTPSQSLAFIFRLKDAVREETADESNARDFFIYSPAVAGQDKTQMFSCSYPPSAKTFLLPF